MKYIKLFLAIQLLLVSFLNPVFSDENEYCTLEKGVKVKLIHRTDNKHNIYIFTDMSSCFSCYENIKSIGVIAKKNNFNLYVILDGLDKDGAESVKKDNNWSIDVVADETGLITSYYKVKIKPTILGIDKGSKVVACGSLNNANFRTIFDSFSDYDKHKIKIENENRLKEIFRIPVLDNDKPVLSNGYHIDVLYNRTKNEYYIKNLRSPNLFIVNSEGKVIKKVTEKRLNSPKAYYSNQSLSWVISDSVLSFVNTVIDFKHIAYFYDVINDTVIFSTEINNPDMIGDLKSGPIVMFNNITNTFIAYPKMKSNNITLDSTVRTIMLFDKSGKYLNSINFPDNIFQKYKASTWFHEYFAFNSKYGHFLSLQQLSNRIKIWDSKCNLIKDIEFKFDNNYRTILADLPDLNGKEFYKQEVQNITRTNILLINNQSQEILVCYYNETYPPDETGVFSDEVIIDRNILILNGDGKWIYNTPYKVNDWFVPFHFENDLIYGTEINKQKQLEIVCYKL